MKIVNGQNAYQGIFVERKKEQQDAITFTEEQKTASVNRVKRAACDSFTVSEEAKSRRCRWWPSLLRGWWCKRRGRRCWRFP